jgi:hypothetical protein
MTKTRTYLDANLLIYVSMKLPISTKVLALLTDPNREFVASDVLILETLPKPKFHKQTASINFLEKYFSDCVRHIKMNQKVAITAFDEACKYGIGDIDALHLASAKAASAAEFITNEKKTKAIYKTKLVRVAHIDDV